MKDLPRGLHESGMNVILITGPNVLIIRWTNTTQPSRIIHSCGKIKLFTIYTIVSLFTLETYTSVFWITPRRIFHKQSALICDSTASLLCVQRTLLMWNIHGQCSTWCTCVVSLLFSLDHTHCQLTLLADCIKAMLCVWPGLFLAFGTLGNAAPDTDYWYCLLILFPVPAYSWYANVFFLKIYNL